MKLLHNIFFLFSIILFVSSCSPPLDKTMVQDKKESPESSYSQAMVEFENKNYDLALEIFKDLERKFPLSNEAVQSQIMSAFIDYIRMDYTEAIFKLNRVIKRYPSYKNSDYAYYLKALCYYEQIENEQLDGKNNILALKNFQQILNRFPESKYARDSEQKIISVKENIAAKHMNIGFFYLKRKKYLAALNRYKKVINEHSQSKFTPEALHRLVEIYYTLGMLEDAKKAASTLGYNYPNSEWYKYSFNIVGEIVETKDKKSLLQKIFKPLSQKNE